MGAELPMWLSVAVGETVCTHQGYSPSHRVLEEEHLSQARRVLFLGRACSLDSSPSAATAEKSLKDLLSPSASASPSTSMRPGLVSVSIMSTSV